VLFTLKRFSEAEKECEELSVHTWNEHSTKGKYGFDNPDHKAYTPLASSGDHTLKQAREIDCMLKEAVRNQDLELLDITLDLITTNNDYLRFSLSTLIDTRNHLMANKGKKPAR